MESIFEMGESAQEGFMRGEESRRLNVEKETAESVRKRSMERLAETRERESPENATKRKRLSGGRETMEYLKEKNQKENEMR